jgi:DNA polymerase-3 subunit epsilon
MTILFFDTETTGKIDRRKPPQDDAQPDLVQLAAILTDDTLTEIASINCIVFPTYWDIPDEAANVHGIRQEKAEAFGLSLPTAITAFCEFADIANRFVAHNSEFDVVIIQRALARLKRDIDPFEGKEVRCTMKAAKPVLKLPNRNPGVSDPYKFPKLEECIRHFFNEGIENAHDALADVRATIRLYGALCKHYGIAP